MSHSRSEECHTANSLKTLIRYSPKTPITTKSAYTKSLNMRTTRCRDNLCHKNSVQQFIWHLKTYSQGVSTAETFRQKVWSDGQTSLSFIVLLRLQVDAQLLKHKNNDKFAVQGNKASGLTFHSARQLPIDWQNGFSTETIQCQSRVDRTSVHNNERTTKPRNWSPFL